MTRVREVRVDVLEMPLRVPVATTDHRWATRRLAIVRLIAEDGLEGIGEVAGGEPDGLPAPIPNGLVGRFAGLDLADPAELDERLREIERVPSIGRALRSALETAAVDLLARAAGVSVAASLAAGPYSRVPLNGLVGIDTPEAAARAAVTLTEAGFTCLKLKGGREQPMLLAERVRAVRAAVGPAVRLRLDVNGTWSGLTEAITAIEAVAGFDLEYIEQPLPPELGPGTLATLRCAVSVPLAADESVTDPEAARALLEAGAADVLVVKPARVGGIRQARRIADLAAAAGVPIVVSTLFETGIGVAAALHLAATLGDGGREHGLATVGLLASDLLAEPLSIVDGSMTLPSGPGLGVRLDPVAVETYQAR
ncbi:MAG: mandelate racemase/muconate lactonizing enzyme family protein [Chloroflexi bacterium]|nr:mandelate racemase/muconate lactonizing enzyme family protein [Chloroflexota bacterium]